jgi:trigger factor
VNITVNDLTSVDKEIILTATREELAPAFDKAYKKFSKQVNLPGFRAGKAPLDLIKKRYGRDIELDEVRNYVLDVYNDKILEEYKPMGESDFKEVSWENDQLKAVILVGIEPRFELVDLSSIEIDRMIHDVSDDDVNKEIDYLLEKEGTWSVVEQAATEDNLIVADVFSKDHDGNLIEGDVDPDQEFNLREPKNADYKPFLLGKVAGDEVDAEIKHGDHSHLYKLVVKSVKALSKPDLSEELIEKFSNGQYKTEEDYRAFLKSRVQEYYDQTAETMLKNELSDALVNAHEFEVPETLQTMLIKRYLDDMRQRYNIKQELDVNAYRAMYVEKAIKDAKWYFINQKLADKFTSEIELNEADVDTFLEKQATQMGYPLEILKNAYASNPGELENLRLQIREEKVYDKALEIVKINDLDKEAYQEKHNPKSE